MKNLLNAVISYKSIAATPLLLALSLPAFATGDHDHEKMEHGHQGMKMDMGMKHSGSHRHSKWVKPPAAYANMKSDIWGDAAAAKRGEKLYAVNCSSCHGKDGTGNGPVAKSLPHAPADLTNNFHKAPGDGDAYLFWRVSEGGQVEPFKSMKSSMPSFKTSLSESQRWDVLAYVHSQFHKGFLNKKEHKEHKEKAHDEEAEHGHHH